MGFVVKEERERGEESSRRPRALAIVDVSRRYDEGARIGSSGAHSLAPALWQDRQVQRDSRRAGFSRLSSVRRELSDNFSSVCGSRRHNASEYVSTRPR